MNPAIIIEKWDGVLYTIYNGFITAKTAIIRPPFLKKNKSIKNRHLGERCFVVMNGPSINELDLSFLKGEIVFASNYFYRSELAKVVGPNYYCWADSKLFDKDESIAVVGEIKKVCPQAVLLLHHKAFKRFGDREDVFYIYCRHMANVFGISTNLACNASNYSTVAFHAVSEALYMGFKEIYILGLDFAPGAFKHFANLGVDCEDPTKKESKFDVAGNYWNYTKSQYESFYLREYADKHNQRIINLNPDSYIRAFEFGDYNNLFE